MFMNVNEILYNGLYDLVADVTCGGMVLNDGYVVEEAWENGKMIGFEDLLEIVENNDTSRFYNIEMRYEEGTQTIKSLCRHWTKNQLNAYGVKFNNGTMLIGINGICKVCQCQNNTNCKNCQKKNIECLVFHIFSLHKGNSHK